MAYMPTMYRAADYLRLSKEDGEPSFSVKKQESDSISSQRALIEGYVAKCPDIELVAEYVDDGYTGTNFDRPDFKRMMGAVERGEINCIIANFAVYGYQRDPEDKNHLLIDEEAAAIVRDIFRWKIEGINQVKIADKLNERGILCPAYKKAKGSRYATSFQMKQQATWSHVSISRITSGRS